MKLRIAGILFPLLVICALVPSSSQNQNQPVINTLDYCRSFQHKLGKCVNLQDCSLFSSWLKQRPVVKSNVKTIVKYTCYFDLRQPKVCCPLQDIRREREQNEVENLIQGTHQQRAPKITRNEEEGGTFYFPPEEIKKRNNDNHKLLTFSTRTENKRHKSLEEKLKLLPKLEQCGSTIQLSRHVGTFGAYPWIALLGYKDKYSGEWKHVCSGTIINEKYIITSSTCVRNQRYPITHMRVGEYDLLTRIDQGSPYLPNSEYDEYTVGKATSIQNDIALLRIGVGEEIRFSQYVTPICLPFADHYSLSHHLQPDNPEFTRKSKFLVAGWGRLYHNSSIYRTLQEASVTVLPDSSDECGTSPETYCIGANKRHSICLTDSGSGLFLPMRIRGARSSGLSPKVFLMGVLSSAGPSAKQCQNEFSPEAPSPNANEHRLILLRNGGSRATMEDIPKPTFYAKVSNHLEWILQKIEP